MMNSMISITNTFHEIFAYINVNDSHWNFSILTIIVKYYQILSNIIKYYQILSNIIKYYQILSNIIKYYQILSNIIKYYRVILKSPINICNWK